MAQAADFFVSYTSADRSWAEWIAWQLEAEGYQVVVQAWDFTPGRSWTHEMQQATATAERVVAVLSAAYLASEHGEAEWEAFQAKDPLGKRGLLLPVRVSEVEPPGLLASRIYVDLVGRDAASARSALLAAARGARGKPTEQPEFPGGSGAAGSATEAPRFPSELPPVWSVPFHPNPFFTGREQLLAELEARLHAADVTVRRVVLSGLGGVGKTSVAVEFVYRHHADYDLVWCVNGEQPASLLTDLAALAGQLGLAPDAPQEAQVAALRGWLERHQRWLLVLDNVDDPQRVVELLPRSGTGHVLVTSRTAVGWEPLASVLPVEVLNPADAAELLQTRAAETGPAAEAAAAKLAATLGGLPLALEQAGAYVASTGTVTLVGYVELFATRAPELLKRGQPLSYQHTVATTWSLALQHLRDTETAAVDLLTLASFLAPDDLPQPLLAVHHDQLMEPLATVAGDPLALADAVAALRRYSLIRVVADGLYIHRLLQTVIRTGLGVDDERVWVATAVRLMRLGFPSDSDSVAAWPECQRLLPHVLAVADHGRRLDLEPAASLWLLQQAAVYLRSRGQYRQARTLYEQTLAGRQQLLGDDHPDTLQSMHNLADIHRNLGDLQGAHQLFEQTLAARRRVLGDDHPDTLMSMNYLAVARRALGNLPGAQRLHEQTLAARQRVLGDDHPDTLTSMNHLAEIRRNLGDLKGALELHKRTLAARQRVLGDDHPHTLWSMNDLAETHRHLGDLQGALQLFEQTLAARQRVLGDDHPHTLWSMNGLAETHRALGDLQGAYELHEQTLAARRRVLGDDHPDTLQSMNNLAQVRRESRRRPGRRGSPTRRPG
jgi:tetratricopeptide (TPR) repeat protein